MAEGISFEAFDSSLGVLLGVSSGFLNFSATLEATCGVPQVETQEAGQLCRLGLPKRPVFFACTCILCMPGSQTILSILVKSRIWLHRFNCLLVWLLSSVPLAQGARVAFGCIFKGALSCVALGHQRQDKNHCDCCARKFPRLTQQIHEISQR